PKYQKMKLKTTLIAAMSMATIATSQAFVIDFNDTAETFSDAFDSVGSSIDNSTGITINVAGYGDVVINMTTIVDGNNLQVGGAYTDGGLNINSIELDNNGDQVTVTFPTNVIVFNAQSLDEDTSESLDVDGTVPGNVHTITANLVATVGNENPGIGIQAIKFDVVPEPSSTALGALGLGILLLKRRRA
ncbi:MAG: PEP-CTERM sorting domain-containing protein, partial [Akkermansiaceae bacterium]|nr:PEP-CTERM sorting domain-containing protein [Akkermansiaceae bacterium]